MLSSKGKAFTLIEMLLVVIILWILMSIWVNRLALFDSDKYYSESCVNTLYGPLSEWIYYAATSKSLSWDIMPDKYVIQTINQTSWFVLNYEKNGINIYYTGLLSNLNYCQKGDRYKVFFSADFDRIIMLPLLRSYGNQNGFEILKKDGGSSLATGAMYLKFCSPASETMCRDFWEIVFDARTAMIKKRFCKIYYPKDESNSGKEKQCKERTTGV